MQLIDGKLHILGTHRVWNGSSWQGPYQIAHFDGQEFCSFGGQDIFPRDVAGLNGQLYVTTGYYIHADTFGGIAKWIGGDSTDICISQPVRIQDPTLTAEPTISLYPNPTNTAFSLNLPPNSGSCILRFHDITGREVAAPLTYLAGDPPVDVAHLSTGLYFVEVRVKDRVEVVKLVKE
ncbi:MAG TPA: T9SS type A sorting domain-containing protein [Bacteroidia bacterium]|nr:T9SS type A sorting domain-containing protein [Bacteroidia bacterium]